MEKQKLPQAMKPDYKRIFADIITMKYPGKESECKKLLSKDTLTVFDIIELNKKIFGEDLNDSINQRHKSYTKKDIFQILEYQKKNRLNNSETARHFNLSRNTLAQWKKKFLV